MKKKKKLLVTKKERKIEFFFLSILSLFILQCLLVCLLCDFRSLTRNCINTSKLFMIKYKNNCRKACRAEENFRGNKVKIKNKGGSKELREENVFVYNVRKQKIKDNVRKQKIKESALKSRKEIKNEYRSIISTRVCFLFSRLENLGWFLYRNDKFKRVCNKSFFFSSSKNRNKSKVNYCVFYSFKNINLGEQGKFKNKIRAPIVSLISPNQTYREVFSANFCQNFASSDNSSSISDLSYFPCVPQLHSFTYSAAHNSTRSSNFSSNPDFLVEVSGWIKSLRRCGSHSSSKKAICFIEINDGSSSENLQVILHSNLSNSENFIQRCKFGASAAFCGVIQHPNLDLPPLDQKRKAHREKNELGEAKESVKRRKKQHVELLVKDELAGHFAKILGDVTTRASKENTSNATNPQNECKSNQKNQQHKLETFPNYDVIIPPYPFSKQKHSKEYLRNFLHLRSRTKYISTIMRLRSKLYHAIHLFFLQNNIMCVHTPIITKLDCEGAGRLFRATISNENSKEANNSKNQTDFFGKDPAYLSVSGQLYLESLCSSLGSVYTFSPAFRADPSDTGRHLAEFWMLEVELAFADLDILMNFTETFIKFLIRFCLEKCADDLIFLNGNDLFLKRFEKYVLLDFARISYSEAIKALINHEQSGNACFKTKVLDGADMSADHEKFIAQKMFGCPTFIYKHPKSIKPFYAKLESNLTNLVYSMDLVVPDVGELVGGTQREEILSQLDLQMRNHNISSKDYEWYRQLRAYGSIMHSGFGFGFERFLMFVSNVTNIRDVIAFPRFYHFNHI